MDLLAALALQIEWGADEALAEVAPDRLTPAPRPAPRSATTAPRPRAAAIPAPVVAPDMAALLDAYAGLEGCALRDTATSFVRPSGDPDAGLVWLTGPPGEADDRTGQPAAGPEGALLDRMLASIGLARGGLLLVPIIPWRPPGGRPPNSAEIAQCLPFVHRLLALARPRTLVLEAGPPAQALLPRDTARGRRDAAGLTPLALPDLADPVAVLVMPSLAGIAQSADRRREAWARLRLLRRHLDDKLAKS
jgi:DNA polymerase